MIRRIYSRRIIQQRIQLVSFVTLEWVGRWRCKVDFDEMIIPTMTTITTTSTTRRHTRTTASMHLYQTRMEHYYRLGRCSVDFSVFIAPYESSPTTHRTSLGIFHQKVTSSQHINSTSLRAITRSYDNYLRLIYMLSDLESWWCIISCYYRVEPPPTSIIILASGKCTLQLLLHNYTNSKNHLIRLYRSLLGSMMISYLFNQYDMAPLLLLLLHLNATACSVEVLFLTAHSDCNTLLFTMITPKHPFSWRWLVPYT